MREKTGYKNLWVNDMLVQDWYVTFKKLTNRTTNRATPPFFFSINEGYCVGVLKFRGPPTFSTPKKFSPGRR